MENSLVLGPNSNSNYIKKYIKMSNYHILVSCWVFYFVNMPKSGKGHSSVVEHLPSIQEGQGSMPHTTNQKYSQGSSGYSIFIYLFLVL